MSNNSDKIYLIIFHLSSFYQLVLKILYYH